MSWEGALDLWIESHWGARLFHNPPTSCVRCLSGDGRDPDLSALSQLSCVCVCVCQGSRSQQPGSASCVLWSACVCPVRTARCQELGGVAWAFPVQDDPGALGAESRCDMWVLGPPPFAPGTASSATSGRGWGPSAGCRARARTPGSVRAVYVPVRAPRGSSPALGAAFAATVSSLGPPPLPPSRGLCPRGPRRSPRARRTSSRRMPGPVPRGPG